MGRSKAQKSVGNFHIFIRKFGLICVVSGAGRKRATGSTNTGVSLKLNLFSWVSPTSWRYNFLGDVFSGALFWIAFSLGVIFVLQSLHARSVHATGLGSQFLAAGWAYDMFSAWVWCGHAYFNLLEGRHNLSVDVSGCFHNELLWFGARESSAFDLN